MARRKTPNQGSAGWLQKHPKGPLATHAANQAGRQGQQPPGGGGAPTDTSSDKFTPPGPPSQGGGGQGGGGQGGGGGWGNIGFEPNPANWVAGQDYDPNRLFVTNAGNAVNLQTGQLSNPHDFGSPDFGSDQRSVSDARLAALRSRAGYDPAAEYERARLANTTPRNMGAGGMGTYTAAAFQTPEAYDAYNAGSRANHLGLTGQSERPGFTGAGALAQIASLLGLMSPPALTPPGPPNMIIGPPESPPPVDVTAEPGVNLGLPGPGLPSGAGRRRRQPGVSQGWGSTRYGAGGQQPPGRRRRPYA